MRVSVLCSIISFLLLGQSADVAPDMEAKDSIIFNYGHEVGTDNLLLQSLSGITYNAIDGLYHGVMANDKEKKGLFGFDITFDDNDKLAVVDEQVIGMDVVSGSRNGVYFKPKSVAFVENSNDPANPYFLVAGYDNSNEGDAYTVLSLYDTSGTELNSAVDQINPLVVNKIESQHLQSIQSIAVLNGNKNYLVYAAGSGPVNDRGTGCAQGQCLRIFVSEFSVDAADKVTINELYQVRYDLDVHPTDLIVLSDITIFEDKEGNLNALVMERKGSRVPNTSPTKYLYETKIYLIALSDNSDVSHCSILDTSSTAADSKCDSANTEKQMVYSFTTDTLSLGSIDQLNFGALTILYGEDMALVSDENIMHLVAINDNGDGHERETFFVHLTWDVTEFLDLKKEPTPSPTGAPTGLTLSPTAPTSSPTAVTSKPTEADIDGDKEENIFVTTDLDVEDGEEEDSGAAQIGTAAAYSLCLAALYKFVM